MIYAYQNNGTSLIKWPGGARSSSPTQSRSGTARSLGSLGDATLVLPAPGAPEPLQGADLMSTSPAKAKCGCGCKGKKKGGCAPKPMADYIAVGDAAAMVQTALQNPVVLVGTAAVAYFLFFKKKRR